jgi:hypothetical protein
MKLAEIRLKKRKAVGICAWEKCKTRESLTVFQHPIGPVQLCRVHVMELDSGEERFVVRAEPAPTISPDGKWVWDVASNSWKPYTPPPATPKPSVVQPAVQSPAVPAVVVQSAPTPPRELRELAPPELDPTVRAEIVSRQAEAGQLLALVKALPLRDNNDLTLVAEVLSDVKGKHKRLEEMKQTVVAPLRKLEDAWRQQFTPAQKLLEEIEALLKHKVEAYHVEMRAREAQAMKTIESSGTTQEVTAALAQLEQAQTTSVPGLTISEVWAVDVLDIEKVPGVYVERKINTKLVKEHAREAEKLGTVLTVPGLKIYKTPQAASKAK